MKWRIHTDAQLCYEIDLVQILEICVEVWTGIAEQLQFLFYLQVFRTAGFCSPPTFPINVILIYPNDETKQNLSLQEEREVVRMQQLLVSRLSVQLLRLFHSKFKVIFRK